MIARTTIRCPIEQLPVVEFMWTRKGTKKNGYLLSGFKVYVYEQNLKSIKDYKTRLTLETIVSKVVKLQAIRKLKTETDLKLLMNGIILSYEGEVMLEYNDSVEFSFMAKVDTTVKDTIKQIKSKAKAYNTVAVHYTQSYLDKKYIKSFRNAKLKGSV